MSESTEKHHSNPLLPLILLLMLVLLLTVIASNLKPSSGNTLFSILEPEPEIEQFILNNGDSTSGISSNFTNEDHVIRKAARNWRIGKIDEAESDFRTILIFDPENLAALSYLGTIFYAQGKYEEAEFVFRKKTACYPSQAIGFRNLGMSLFRLGRIKEAINEVKRATCLDPMDMESVILLARLYAYTGDQSNAAACLKRAKLNGIDLKEILQENVFRTFHKTYPNFSEMIEKEQL